MRQRLLISIYYFIFWIIFFIVARIIFLLNNYDLSKTLTIIEWLKIFIYGVRMDASAAGYICILPTLFLAFSVFFSHKPIKYFFISYSSLILFILCFITIADAQLYTFWRFRADASLLIYLQKPTDVFLSLTKWQIIKSFLFWFVFFLVSFYWFIKLFLPIIKTIIRADLKTFAVMILATATWFIPIRSSFSFATMNTAFVYFSKTNMFANHAAVNVAWNGVASLLKKNKIKTYQYMSNEKANSLFEALITRSNTQTKSVLKTNTPNIILIICESLTSKVIEPLGGLKNCTPHINRLCSEGLLFKNFYATNNRTEQGMVALLSGYPSLPTQSVIHFQKKIEKMPAIPKILANYGYTSIWIYGGDDEFCNYKSYMIAAGFNKIFNQNDFPKKQKLSSWGVPDEFLFEKLLQQCNQNTVPFFITAQTLSSHEPFDIPRKPYFNIVDEQTKFLNSIYYLDSTLNVFIEKAKQCAWWDNTLIIITADHGARMPGNSSHFDVSKYSEIMLWLGGALKITDTTNTTFTSQIDFPCILLSQLAINCNQFKFSKNVLSDSPPSFAAYFFNDGFGFINETSCVIYNNINNTFVFRQDGTTDDFVNAGKAFLQIVSNDFKNK